MSVVTSRETTDAVYLHPDDNICVAARNVSAGQMLGIAGTTLTLPEAVRLGHKIAVRRIRKGDFVRDYASATAVPPLPEPITDRTFLGYKRPGGKAGTRNYIAVISTVNCSATVSRFIAQRFDQAALRDFPNIDGVIAVKHGGGCGIQYKGLQHEVLNRTLARIARHPNIARYPPVRPGR